MVVACLWSCFVYGLCSQLCYQLHRIKILNLKFFCFHFLKQELSILLEEHKQMNKEKEVWFVSTLFGLFQKKNCNPPVEDINGKFQGGRVKVVGIPEGYTKNCGKNMDFQGGQWKKIENSRGVTVNFTGNPGGSTSKKSISSTGGLQFFSGKAHYFTRICTQPFLAF